MSEITLMIPAILSELSEIRFIAFTAFPTVSAPPLDLSTDSVAISDTLVKVLVTSSTDF